MTAEVISEEVQNPKLWSMGGTWIACE